MNSALFLIVAISAQVVYGSILDEIREDVQLSVSLASCATLKGITPDNMLLLRNLVSPADNPTQCFLACVAKAVGILKSDNTIDKAVALVHIRPLVEVLALNKNKDAAQLTETIVSACVTLPSNTDKCLAAKLAFDCFAENARKNGL